VLGQLAKYEFITEEELPKLQDEPLNLHYRVENQNTGAAPYFREAIRLQVLAAIKELNQERPEDQQLNLYTSGLRIYTMRRNLFESTCVRNKSYFMIIGVDEIRG
jgi:penicillin-binding protein 1A